MGGLVLLVIGLVATNRLSNEVFGTIDTVLINAMLQGLMSCYFNERHTLSDEFGLSLRESLVVSYCSYIACGHGASWVSKIRSEESSS